MDTKKPMSTDKLCQLTGYEKIKISARKMEMSPEKIDDAWVRGGLQAQRLLPTRTPMKNSV